MGWSVIEPGMYLTAAYLFTLRPVLRKAWPNDFGSRIRKTIIFRRTYNTNSDDIQGLRGKAQPQAPHHLALSSFKAGIMTEWVKA